MSTSARETYDQLAPVYDERWAEYTEATISATIVGMAVRPGDRILDLATGTGELARRFLAAEGVGRFIGVDVSRGMLARGLAKAELQSWTPVQADVARLPFAEATFDGVVSANAFHLFTQPTAVLQEARRVLRPGGLLTLTDWCDDYLTCKLCGLWLGLTDPSFRRSYTLAECRRLLERAGFRVLAQERFKLDWLWGLMRLIAVGKDDPNHAGPIEDRR